MKKYKDTADNLIDMLSACTCSFTTVKKSIEALKENGFEALVLNEKFDIKECGRYYINLFDSSLFAFTVGNAIDTNSKIRMVAAHTDHPCLYIKPNPELKRAEYGMVNVEMYGGMILNTWLDRPLSAAGKVMLKSDNVMKPEARIIDFNKSLFTIPNLAIHQNRDVNKGIELNKQKDMIPVCTMVSDTLNKDDYFMEYLANYLKVNKEDILDFEIYIYNNDIPETIGLNDEFISSPRLDNITSVVAAINGIVNARNERDICAIALFDNEEIGSRTKQGADSNIINMIFEKIYRALSITRTDYLDAVMGSYCISLDVAHGEHPNKLEKSDETNKNPLNSGIVIKRACSQTYATDSETIAILEQIMQKAEIPYQKFTSRSDVTTGSTLGAYIGKYMPMRMVDVGVPVLAMHSAREMMGAKDQRALEKLVEEFFNVVV